MAELPRFNSLKVFFFVPSAVSGVKAAFSATEFAFSADAFAREFTSSDEGAAASPLHERAADSFSAALTAFERDFSSASPLSASAFTAASGRIREADLFNSLI